MKIVFFKWVILMPILTILFGVDIVLVSGKCQRDQQRLLLELKSSLKFQQFNSTKLVSWNSSIDCCTWVGVTCDAGGLGRVIGLDLSMESISGGIENSTDLLGLQFLRSLDLSFNNFNTMIPAWFGNLTGLINLNLSNTGFMGQIPIEISQMTRLVSLDLSSSMLYSQGGYSLRLEKPNLATLVQSLTKLAEIHLDGVNISAHGNDWCLALSSSLPNLQVLSMSRCFLSGPIHSSLARLRYLSVIRLNENNLSAPVPEFFANFPNLTALLLRSCELTGTFPINIFKIPTLEILDLSNNKLLQGSFPEFHQNLSLRSLVLSNTSFSGRLPESIGSLRKLSRIDLGNCNFSGPIPSSMANITQLVYMDFSYNQLKGEIWSTRWEGLLNLVYLDLRYNNLHGTIPASLFANPTLQKIQFSFNQFDGQLPNFSNSSSSLLDTVDLSSNRLEGFIPRSFFELKGLNILLLSSNKLNGTVPIDWIQKLGNLTKLDLSYNNLTVDARASSSTLSSLPQKSTLKLASCNMRVFPDLSNQSKLIYLDLSDNKISGVVPNWIWKVGNGSLAYLNLSHNFLEDLQQPYYIPSSLYVLDLHDNQLQGNIPTPPLATYVDYSSNNFSSFIPHDIGIYLSVTVYFSLSKNDLRGAIPQSICNAGYIEVLDLSHNNLNGTIPACLIASIGTLGVLNLRSNNLNGNIPDKFPGACMLKTLDLSGNNLRGNVPASVSNCAGLEVLDLGNNQINDTFPCLLKNMPSLRVLVLRNNMFNGPIKCLQNHGTWSSLQIVDLAHNHFSGHLPEKCLFTWKALIRHGNETHDHIAFDALYLSGLYYQDSVTVTSKGLEMELVKILTFFTSIDFSSNNFTGPIPEVLGKFTALYALNLSHNSFTGQIPSSLGNLSQLESLDLSVNRLTGEIPQQLARLTFLSFLNLSNNSLVGPIPSSTQLQTFSITSFAGNEGLCGSPLTRCRNSSGLKPGGQPYQTKEFRNGYDWNFIVPGMGFGLGAGAAITPLMFWKKANKWCDDSVDRVLLVLLPMLGLTYHTRDDWRIEPEDDFEEDSTDADDDEEEENNDNFGGRYCVFCTKLDITRKRVIHEPNCTCQHSTPISSSSSLSFSSL